MDNQIVCTSPYNLAVYLAKCRWKLFEKLNIQYLRFISEQCFKLRLSNADKIKSGLLTNTVQL